MKTGSYDEVRAAAPLVPRAARAICPAASRSPATTPTRCSSTTGKRDRPCCSNRCRSWETVWTVTTQGAFKSGASGARVVDGDWT